jgi:hypothetical protein
MLGQYSTQELVSATDPNGLTALHLAVQRDSEDVVELLIKNGADVNARTPRDLELRPLPRKDEFVFDFMGRARGRNSISAPRGTTPLGLAELCGSTASAGILRKNKAEQ